MLEDYRSENFGEYAFIQAVRADSIVGSDEIYILGILKGAMEEKLTIN